MATISVILPTVGRPTLAAVLRSYVAAGLSGDDEVIILNDGGNRATWRALEETRDELIRMAGPDSWLFDVRVIDILPAGGDYGHPARNYGMSIARKDWLMFGQDDNVLTADCIGDIRSELDANPGAVHIWRAIPSCGIVVPAPGDDDIRLANVDADCIVCRNDPGALGTWGRGYNGDWPFIRDTVAIWNGAVVFHDAIISECKR